MAERHASSSNERPKHRSLTTRIIVTGTLELTSPAHFGNGDADEWTDLPLLVDEVDGRALLTGASLAGALRNYLRERQWGYERHWQETEEALLATKLFGGHRGFADGAQSSLIVDDALSTVEGAPDVELRDGVKIDSATRTAEPKKKYDYQLLRAGTCFKLNFELLLDDQIEQNRHRKKALALALDGLAKGEIRLGAKKRRGFGCCCVEQWTVMSYDLLNPNALCAWLIADYAERDKHEVASPWKITDQPEPKTGVDIFKLIDVELTEEDQHDQRESFEIQADFEIDGSLIIRGGFDEQDRGLDVVHLRTKRIGDKDDRAVLSGTSIAGAIRQRAARILNTLVHTDDRVKPFINSMFGPEEIRSDKPVRSSRVVVEEEFITDGHSQYQTRIKIDRFTGGTIASALLEEASHYGGTVRLRLALRNPQDKEIGLLLLVLKDIWLGDLAFGGESSVGRGRLRGISADLYRNGEGIVALRDDARNGVLSVADENTATELETYVNTLNQWAEGL